MREKIKNAIDERGLKMNYVQKKLGVSKQTLYRKISGNTQWYIRELKVFKEILHLSNDEFVDIFFNL